jgi:hypothetical protein
MAMSESGMNLVFEELDCQETSCYKVYTQTKQKYLGEIVFDISCGWVYLTDEEQVGSMGFCTSPFLRAIADKLDELNAELFKEMSEPLVTQC